MTDAKWFDTLSNPHPIPRKGKVVKADDPRNDRDYDTFLYGTEPLPGDRTWCFHQAGIKPAQGKFKGV